MKKSLFVNTSAMKSYFACVTAASMFLLSSCGGAEELKKVAETEAAKVVSVVIDGSSWVATDLSTISTSIPMTVNLPKDVKMEKNGNGGVDISLNEAYTLTVSSLMVSSVKKAIEEDKTITVNHKSFQNGKVIIDEPNGFVYTHQMKDETNGTKYEPESHFAFYLEKDGAFYSIMDARPLKNSSLSGKTYTEENAKKLFEIVKTTAKLK